jgi:hypothetical protein
MRRRHSPEQAVSPHSLPSRERHPNGGYVCRVMWNFVAKMQLTPDEERRAIEFAHEVGFKTLSSFDATPELDYNALIRA